MTRTTFFPSLPHGLGLCLKQALSAMFLLLLAAPLAAAELSSSVDRTVISENETLELTVRVNEQVGGFDTPDFSALEEDFDILSNQRSSQFRNVNGLIEAWTDWTLVLAPKSEGTLAIPAFNFKGASSDPLQIQVRSASASDGGAEDLFVEIETSKDEVFVQEQLLLTIRIHTGIQLRDASMTEELKIDNAVVENVSETAYNKRIDGRMYRVMELVYAIYPQQSEAIRIPSLSWNLVMATERGSGLRYRFQAPGELRRLRSEPLTIPVHPRPADYQGTHWLPAKSVRLEQHWSSDPSRFVVGEPLTRTITLVADGLTSSQLPPLPSQEVEGVKVYADQAQFDDITNSEGVTGSRIESVAIVPSRPGTVTLPAMRVSWWNTDTDRQEVAMLPAQTLEIAAATGGSNVPAMPQGESLSEDQSSASEGRAPLLPTTLWPWLVGNVIFATLAAIFFLAWLRARKHKPELSIVVSDDHNPAADAAFDAVRRACADGNPLALRRALGEWGRRYWQLPHRASAQEIARRCDSRAITKELAKLDQILYGTEQLARENSDWRGDALWRALVKFKRKDKKRRQQKAHTDQLAPLYPTAQ